MKKELIQEFLWEAIPETMRSSQSFISSMPSHIDEERGQKISSQESITGNEDRLARYLHLSTIRA